MESGLLWQDDEFVTFGQLDWESLDGWNSGKDRGEGLEMMKVGERYTV